MTEREHQAVARLLDELHRARHQGVEIETAELKVDQLRMSVTWDFVEGCYRTRVTCAHHQYDLESRQGSEPVMACTKCGEEQA